MARSGWYRSVTVNLVFFLLLVAKIYSSCSSKGAHISCCWYLWVGGEVLFLLILTFMFICCVTFSHQHFVHCFKVCFYEQNFSGLLTVSYLFQALNTLKKLKKKQFGIWYLLSTTHLFVYNTLNKAIQGAWHHTSLTPGLVRDQIWNHSLPCHYTW